jgi:hypothetical protein
MRPSEKIDEGRHRIEPELRRPHPLDRRAVMSRVVNWHSPISKKT